MVERASRYETWLDEQVSTITTTPDGTTVLPSKVILEMEGEVWGTWAVSTPNLTEVVRQTVVRVGEELSKGQHPAKLIALDSAGQTLAQHPLTIRGNSSAARQGTEQMEMQRAMTILVGNLESVSHSLTTQIDLLSKQNQDLIGQNLSAISALQEVVASKAESQLAIARQEARDARLAEMVKQFAPALGAAAEILVARFAAKLPGILPDAAPGAPPAPTPSAPGLETSPPPTPPAPAPPAPAPTPSAPGLETSPPPPTPAEKGGSKKPRTSPKKR